MPPNRTACRDSVVDLAPILLDTASFVEDLHLALAGAASTIDIQLMTFDGDASGLAVAERLIEAAGRGVRVRLLIDSFARRFVSDRPVGRPEVRDEFARTRRMFGELAAAGVAVRFTNPNGPLRLFALARNHKKLFLIDGAAYVGGINVSDHNFAWHDFMVKFRSPDLVRLLGDDFDASFTGIRRQLDGPVVLSDRAIERAFDDGIAGAARRVVVASPYALDQRLVAALTASPAPERRLVLAPVNNFRSLDLVTPHLQRRLLAAGVRVESYGRFSHAKFLLFDDRLLVGSSNYGRHSFWCNREIGLLIDDPGFVAAFEASMLGDEVVPVDIDAGPVTLAAGAVLSTLMIRALAGYARLVAGRVPPLDPRPMPWTGR